jgi:hypothetical protein
MIEPLAQDGPTTQMGDATSIVVRQQSPLTTASTLSDRSARSRTSS